MRALTDHVENHTVGTDNRYGQGERGEDAEQDHRYAARCQRIGHDVLHGRDVVDHVARIQLSDRAANRPP
jgi:hypothetical protein